MEKNKRCCLFQLLRCHNLFLLFVVKFGMSYSPLDQNILAANFIRQLLTSQQKINDFQNILNGCFVS